MFERCSTDSVQSCYDRSTKTKRNAFFDRYCVGEMGAWRGETGEKRERVEDKGEEWERRSEGGEGRREEEREGKG